ncbi:MAG: flagellar basal body rod protein FlgB [Phycisphaerales bacterium JB060]
MLQKTLQSGSIPTLEAMMRFTGQRQRLLAHNVANLTTPNFQAVDVSPKAFQEVLGEAVADRRKATGGVNGPLEMRSTREVRMGRDGSLDLTPLRGTRGVGGVLLHDRNDRDVERLMQSMTENYGVYRVASDLMRSRVGVLRTAISQRVT